MFLLNYLINYFLDKDLITQFLGLYKYYKLIIIP